MRSLLIVADNSPICAFSKPSAPVMMPVPQAPSQTSNAAAERQMAEREQLKAAATSGVRQNIHAGADIARQEQAARLAKKKNSAAGEDLLGGVPAMK